MLAEKIMALLIIAWAVVLVILGFFGRLARIALEWVIAFVVVAGLVLGAVWLVSAGLTWLAG